MFHRRIMLPVAFTFTVAFGVLSAQDDQPAEPSDTDSGTIINDEGPFVGGVFSQKSGEIMVTAEPDLPERPPLSTDELGNTNQLIVVPNFDDTSLNQEIAGRSGIGESRADMEAAVISALNDGYPSAVEFFVNPIQVWHLLWRDRLTEEDRELLEENDLKNSYIST